MLVGWVTIIVGTSQRDIFNSSKTIYIHTLMASPVSQMESQRYIPPQQIPQPGPPMPPQRMPNPRSYIGLLLAGVLLLLIGGIIYMSVGFIDDPDNADPWDSDTEREEYQDTVRTITSLGNIIQYVGIMILSVGLIMGAIRDESLHGNVRLGMLIAMGLIIGFKIMSINPFATNI
jgi:hypothetical protein